MNKEEWKKRWFNTIYHKAYMMFDIGYKSLAFDILNCIAEEEHAKSLNAVAILMISQDGAKESSCRKSVHLFKKAWGFGEYDAIWNLAILYKDFMNDPKKALYWFNFIIRQKNCPLKAKAYLEKTKMIILGYRGLKNMKKAMVNLHILDHDPCLYDSLSGEEQYVIDKLYYFVMRRTACFKEEEVEKFINDNACIFRKDVKNFLPKIWIDSAFNPDNHGHSAFDP
jgi:hypothetical protein